MRIPVHTYYIVIMFVVVGGKGFARKMKAKLYTFNVQRSKDSVVLPL